MIKDEHFRFVGVRNGSTHAMLMVNDISINSMVLSETENVKYILYNLSGKFSSINIHIKLSSHSTTQCTIK